MIVKYEKSFLKDIRKITDKKIAIKLKEIIVKMEQDGLNSVSQIKKLKGFENYYRVKIGDYRLGFFYDEKRIDLIRFLHRKDIYKKFP